MSKILEVVVKEDLHRHLLQIGCLPNSQYGFRPGRSTTTALAAAHGSWIKAIQEGKVLGILAFDFSAAFDTVDPTALLSKLSTRGVRGRELDWFHSYLSGGYQCVDWAGTLSEYIPVQYGVRQGSILGPLLFITLMADLPQHLDLLQDEICGYADDVCVWATGKDVDEVRAKLARIAQAFVDFAAGNALSLNESKTQLLLAGQVTKASRSAFSVRVGQAHISPGSEMELLGAKFDSKASLNPYTTSLAKSVKQRASLITRMAHHLPRGNYLRLLAQGLTYGKVSYAAAATLAPRLPGDSSPPSEASKTIQIALNDVARTLTGHKRSDHIPVSTLLHSAQLPSLNEVAVKALAIEAWKAFHSDDGPGASRNPLGTAIFDCGDESKSAFPNKNTRARSQGHIPLPLKFAAPTMVYSAAKIWNQCSSLRSARTLSAARAVAKQLAKAAPI